MLVLELITDDAEKSTGFDYPSMHTLSLSNPVMKQRVSNYIESLANFIDLMSLRVSGTKQTLNLLHRVAQLT